MIQILNVEPKNYSPQARAILEEVGRVVEAPLSRAELQEQVADYDVLIVRLAHQIDQYMLDAGTRLKAIVSATTGLDHIDVDYAATKGITVLSLKGETAFLYSISATAEHTWALLLALLRRIPQAFAHVCDGSWDRDQFRGHELAGQCLGILGLGRIGHKVAHYGLAFGMSVVAFDPNAEEWVDGVERLPSEADLLARSQVLSIHVPLNDDTTHLIGADELAQLPPGAVVVNTARGAVIDEGALVDALESGHLAGAALDVLSGERCSAQMQSSRALSYARTHDNLLITPHIGGATVESMANTEIFMAHKLARFFRETS